MVTGGERKRLRSAWATVRGKRMHALACSGANAAALPVVLLHGLGVSSSYFVPTAERLAVSFEVYAPDLPGHGHSDAPARTCGIAEYADILVEWMDALGLERASLVGNSMGCQVAVEAALRHASRVDRLVLIGPTVEPSARSIPQLFLRLMSDVLHERLTLIWHVVRDYVRAAPRIPGELRAMLAYPMEVKLRELALPTLFVRGERDPIAPRRWIEHAARLVSGRAQIVEVPGTGHAAHYSAADALVRCITPFIAVPGLGAAHPAGLGCDIGASTAEAPMSEKVVAVFASAAEAMGARAALIEEGFTEAQLTVSADLTSDGIAAEAPGQAYENQRTVPGAGLKRLVKTGFGSMRDDDSADARRMAEVQRGGAVLSVGPLSRADCERATATLKRRHAVTIRRA